MKMDTNNKRNYYFLFVLFALLLASCQPGQVTTPVGNPPGTQAATAAPEENISPTVSAEMGGFRIRLIYSDNGRPVRGQNIYLAEMLPLEGGLEGAFVPALDTSTAPRAESTNQGNVVISMVPPGKYALSLLTPQGAILVTDAATNKEITFEVTAGQVTDLGDRKVILNSSFLEPGP